MLIDIFFKFLDPSLFIFLCYKVIKKYIASSLRPEYIEELNSLKNIKQETNSTITKIKHNEDLILKAKQDQIIKAEKLKIWHNILKEEQAKAQEDLANNLNILKNYNLLKQNNYEIYQYLKINSDQIASYTIELFKEHFNVQENKIKFNNLVLQSIKNA